jgi:sugar lactone lactonase YvrE
VFVAGVERSVVLFNINDGAITELVTGIDANVSGTIINDAMVYDGHLILGCKDPQFAEKKAGLYLIRRGERQAAQLADDQVCSNGKAIVKNQDGSHTLYDICSHSKQVVSWRIDFNTTCLTDRRVFVDLTDEPVFPDGMILTPDQGSLIVAIYDPRAESIDGEARQYSIVNGRLQATWICPRSPRVTCPQLVSRGGQIELVLTTAVEGMPAKQRETCSHAGCLFVATTPFTSVSDAPVFPIN